MTQITRKSVPMRGLILLLAMFVGAGLVLSGCGDDDTTTTPAPAPPPPAPAPEPEPEPPAPEAPATPTGLMVSATTETSITWTWNASEGATGYVVQANTDEMWDATDTVTFEGLPFTTETTYTAMELPPETSVFVRIAAAAGTLEAPLVSAFTTHVSGMSAMPPPEPEPEPVAPDPVEVTFSLSDDADSQHFMMADKDDDAATAKASVNTEIMVESNTAAVITPMFVDGANGVSVDAMAGNTPFSYVSWSMLQSAVIDGGATFMVQRTTVGANQEMEPTGDVAYVTCGPFECADGADAPEISIANSGVCNAWDPTVDIQVGKVDNDVVADDRDDKNDPKANDNDGLDLGIVTSSTIAMKVKHVFSGVAGGKNTSVTTNAAKGSDKTLVMKMVEGVIVVDELDKDDDGKVVDKACNDGYKTGRGALFEPEGCFRLIGPGAAGNQTKGGAPNGPDYLSGWSLEISPVDADVGWGRVAWEDDPFEDLTCGDADPIMVSDHVDVCAMFEDEVDYAIGKGWVPMIIFNNDQLTAWSARADKSGGTGELFKTLWFDDDLDGETAMTDFYAAADKKGSGEISESLLDDDEDPMAGDLGKVDLVSDDKNEAGNPDGMADNYKKDSDQADIRKCSEADGGDDDDGSICDAVWAHDVDVEFADRTFGCTATRSVSITCTWDADGGMHQGRGPLPTKFNPNENGNLKNFLKCEAE